MVPYEFGDNENEKTNIQAKNSLKFGIVALISWIMPLIGIPSSLIALILGAISLKSSRKDFARAGISLGLTGIFLSVINLILTNYLLTSGIIDEIIQL